MARVRVLQRARSAVPVLGGGENRPNAGARGYDAAWQRYARRFRARHPLCRRCWALWGIRTAAAVVDHVRRIVGGQADPMFWPRENHQGLCAGCHHVKTEAEKGGALFSAAAPFPGPVEGEADAADPAAWPRWQGGGVGSLAPDGL